MSEYDAEKAIRMADPLRDAVKRLAEECRKREAGWRKHIKPGSDDYSAVLVTTAWESVASELEALEAEEEKP